MSDLVLLPSQAVLTPAPLAGLVEARAAYQELCLQLLDDSDYDSIDGKQVRNKQGWRKLGAAFNISEELLERSVHRDPAGLVMSAEMVVRAVAPSGRYMDAYGAADVRDRCCPKAYGEHCRINRHGHHHCAADCSGRSHFSNPSHDIPSTAMTRAVSRAFEDLFGQGEPVDRGTGEVRSGGQATPPAGPRPAQDTQLAQMRQLCDQHGLLLEDAIRDALGYHPSDNADGPQVLNFGEARQVLDWLRQPAGD